MFRFSHAYWSYCYLLLAGDTKLNKKAKTKWILVAVVHDTIVKMSYKNPKGTNLNI